MNRRHSSSRRVALMLGLVVALVAATTLPGIAAEVDSRLPVYAPSTGVSGSFKSVGSDTMNNLMALWSEGFRRFYPLSLIHI